MPRIPVPTKYDCLNGGSWILGSPSSVVANTISPPEEIAELWLQRWRDLTSNPNLYSRPEGADPNDNTVFRPQDPYYARLTFGQDAIITVTPIIERQLRIKCSWWWVQNNQVQYFYQYRDEFFYFNVCYYIDIYKNQENAIFRGTPYDHFWEYVDIIALPISVTKNCIPFVPVEPIIYLGTAAPPPPPPLNMSCCDCNTIATIIAENAIAEIKQHQATRDLIDRRTIEGLREINKMLQGMQINLDLQPVIDRLNQLEANLWNGLNLSGGEGN